MNDDGDVRGALTAAGLLCRSCGTELPPDSRFCNKCGGPIGPAATAEYKQVTVLFADVVRSMHLAAAVDIERLREIMTELVDRCAAVVLRYGGTVDKFTGDGIMALFGAPVALEDHAERACLAALEVQQEAIRLAGEVERHDGIALQLRVGLNSGQVIAGEIGSDSLGYTAVGEQVGLAQRMESVATPGGVMLSESAGLVEHAAVSVSQMQTCRHSRHKRLRSPRARRAWWSRSSPRPTPGRGLPPSRPARPSTLTFLVQANDTSGHVARTQVTLDRSTPTVPPADTPRDQVLAAYASIGQGLGSIASASMSSMGGISQQLDALKAQRAATTNESVLQQIDDEIANQTQQLNNVQAQLLTILNQIQTFADRRHSTDHSSLIARFAASFANHRNASAPRLVADHVRWQGHWRASHVALRGTGASTDEVDGRATSSGPPGRPQTPGRRTRPAPTTAGPANPPQATEETAGRGAMRH